MKAVCDKYGALLIMDEIMSGMGRSGTLHVWQQEGVVPDIQTIGKGLGGGYAPIAGILINHRVVDALSRGTGAFAHGQTYQGHPIACAAALEVQRIIREGNLVDNVRRMGALLEKGLKERLADHPNVGNIRGKGLFWGVSSRTHAWIFRPIADARRSNSSMINPQRRHLIRRKALRWLSTKKVRYHGQRFATVLAS